MYPYQEYINQESYEQEMQDHQWSNHDNFSSTEQRMLNIEEVVDRVGFQLSEILQEVEEEKEEPPRLSQPTYPLCSHEEIMNRYQLQVAQKTTYMRFS